MVKLDETIRTRYVCIEHEDEINVFLVYCLGLRIPEHSGGSKAGTESQRYFRRN